MPSSWDLYAERGEEIGSRLGELYTVLNARESRRQNVAAAIDRLRRGDHAFAQLGARLGIDSLAQLDDPIVESENAVEARDRRERLLNAPMQRLCERRLVGGDDLALDFQNFTIAIRRSPSRRRPLDLDAREPIWIERRAQRVEARSSVSDTCLILSTA